MATLIDGKTISKCLKAQTAQTIQQMKASGLTPGLAVVMVGEDPASKVYVANKRKACEEVGIYSEEYFLPETTTQEELLRLIDTLNHKKEIHGILVQSPLPQGLDETKVVDRIDPQKDVDAFHALNVGLLTQGRAIFQPCTPAGIIKLIESTGTEIAGKNCVVIGRSDIVGKPLSLMLLQRHGTVTICHSKTTDLAKITRTADILISAVGKAGFVTGDMVKPGAVVIDVGINRNEAGKLCGDVAFAEVEPIASHLTPVPGGVGPMTIAMLLENTVTAAKLQAE